MILPFIRYSGVFWQKKKTNRLRKSANKFHIFINDNEFFQTSIVCNNKFLLENSRLWSVCKQLDK